MKKVLIIAGSPRKDGNSDLLALQFAKGAARKAGDAIHNAIKASILKADGFVNCSNNRFDKKDMLALVYDSKKGYTESFPIRAMRINAAGSVEVYIGTSGTIDEYLPNEG